MKRMILFIIFIAIIASLLLWTLTLKSEFEDDGAEKSDCEAEGGLWRAYREPSDQPLEKPYCQLPFTDHGKDCTDSSQCIGNCAPPDEFLATEVNEDETYRFITAYRAGVTGTCSSFEQGCAGYQVIDGILDLENQALCLP